MLNLPPTVRIFMCAAPTDMRRSFDGLARMVREHLGGDPMSGHLFVFVNRRGDRLKILYWDRDGFALYYKRLEQGTFQIPPTDAVDPAISRTQLAMMLDGIELKSVRQRRRYQLIH